MSCSRKSEYGQISWKDCALLRRVAPGHEFRRVTAGAAEIVEQLLAGQHGGVGDVATAPARQILRIEGDEVHHRRRRLDVAQAAPARRSAWPGSSFSACVQSPACFGTSGVEMPMSPANASADCCRIDGVEAFQPKRPSVSCALSPCRGRSRVCRKCRRRSYRRDRRAPGCRQGGSARPVPSPIICGVTRGESVVPVCSGPRLSVVDRIAAVCAADTSYRRGVLPAVPHRRSAMWPSAASPGTARSWSCPP